MKLVAFLELIKMLINIHSARDRIELRPYEITVVPTTAINQIGSQ
jgi:hypothetical protein